ncbi:hypothetical protein SOVF_124460 isoform B [Spinacia oleracea]|nr:hypothetical protein SOVF_124460 isoform B [Spinacia oleracea]
MSHILVILSSFVLLLVVTHATAITYTVTNNASNTAGGRRFTKEIGASYARRTLASATDFVWKSLQITNPADRIDTVHKVYPLLHFFFVYFELYLILYLISLMIESNDSNEHKKLEYYPCGLEDGYNGSCGSDPIITHYTTRST